MSELERLAAGMLCIGFDGTSATKHAESMLDRGIGAVVLFKRNVESPGQLAELCAGLKRRAGHPLLICVDQEGGRVMRMREPFTIIPSMRELGRTGDVELARQIGRLLARELRAVNIDMNLAPVLDVDTNAGNPVIADRSLGTTPELVARMGCALLRGMQENGVAACGKHFPGHGDTWQDSHYALPRVSHSIDRIARVELVPFEAAIRAGVAAIMTSHVVIEPLDRKYPATMSGAILDGLLRRRLGFDGLVISDDLEMKAIADNFGIEEVLVRGAVAGVDLFCICHSAQLQLQAVEVLVKAVERGELTRDRLRQANRRIGEVVARYVQGPGKADMSVIGCDEHRAIVSRARLLAAAPAADPTEGWR